MADSISATYVLPPPSKKLKTESAGSEDASYGTPETTNGCDSKNQNVVAHNSKVLNKALTGGFDEKSVDDEYFE